jgi:hypothetical protein
MDGRDLGYSRAACSEFPNDNPALHRGVIWYCATVGAASSCNLPVAALSSGVLAIGCAQPIDDDATDELSPEAAEWDAPDDESSILSAGDQDLAACSNELDASDGDTNSEAGSYASSETESTTDSEAQSATDSEIQSATDSEIERDTDTETESDTDSETQNATENDTSDTDIATSEAIEIVDELTFDDDDVDEGSASATKVDPFLDLADMMENAARAAGANDDDQALLRALLGLARTASVAPDPDVQKRLDPQLAVQGPNGLVRAETLTRQVLAWQGILRGESEDYAACGSATLDEWAADLIARVLGSAARAASIRRDLRSRGVAAFGLIAAA